MHAHVHETSFPILGVFLNRLYLVYDLNQEALFSQRQGRRTNFFTCSRSLQIQLYYRNIDTKETQPFIGKRMYSIHFGDSFVPISEKRLVLQQMQSAKSINDQVFENVTIRLILAFRSTD